MDILADVSKQGGGDGRDRVDLGVEVSGLVFPNPFILASGPPTARGSMIKRAFSRGWGGAVTKTIMPGHMTMENVSPRLATLKNAGGSVVGLENIELISPRPLPDWLRDIQEIKAVFPRNILVASIMAEVVKEDWQALTAAVQEAGADAVELNFSCPHGLPEQGVGQAIGQDPLITGEITRWVVETARVPVIVKLTPNITDITLAGRAARDNGAHILSAINTVQALAGIDLTTFEPLPAVSGRSTYGGYSGLAIKPIGLRCTAQLATGVGLPVLGIGGVSCWQHAAEYILAGASALQVCTSVMFQGYDIVEKMKAGLSAYLAGHRIGSPEELRGRALPKISTHEALARWHQVRAKVDQAACRGCGNCMTACRDGGCQAITLNKQNKAVIGEEKCSGCSLCSHTCRWGNISMA